jgi:non-ribosomal peptide synthetase component F
LDTAKKMNVTPFSLLLALFAATFHGVTERRQLAVVLPVENRRWQGAESVMGILSNLMCIPIDVQPSHTLKQHIQDVCGVLFSALLRQELPFSEVVRSLRASRTDGRHPITGLNFVFTRGAPSKELSIPGAQVTTSIGGAFLDVKFELALSVEVSGDSAQQTWMSRAPTYPPELTIALMSAFCRLLERLPSALEMRIEQLALGHARSPV